MAIIGSDELIDRPTLGDCFSDSDCAFGMECVLGVCRVASSTCIEGATSTETSYPATGYIKYTTYRCVGGVMTSTGVDYFCDTEAGYGLDPAYSSVTCTINNKCTGCTISCSCSSVGYSGSCSGTDYSTCYTTCTQACNPIACPSGYSCTYNSGSTSGKQYYGSSFCDAQASFCAIATQTCNTSCTSVANRETRSGSESCTRSCSIANGTCSYSGSTQTYTDTCASNYAGGGCSSAGDSCSGCNSWTRTSTGECTGGTISITCNAGYYLSNGTCVKCEAGYYCPGDNSRYGCTNKPDNSVYVGSSTSNSCPWSCNAGYYGSSANGNTSCADCGSGNYCTGGTHRASCTTAVKSGAPAPSSYVSLSSGSWSDYTHGASLWDCICDWYFSDDTRVQYLNQQACANGPGGNNYTDYSWCRTGYYAADPLGWNSWYTSCKACTNKPANSYYTSYSTPSTMYAVESNCPWECNSGYHKEESSCVSNTKSCSGNLSGAQYGNITWNGSAWVYTGCYKDCAEGGIYMGYSYYTGSGWGTCKPISSSSGCHWGYYNDNGQSCVACPAGEWCYNSRYTCPAGYFCPGGTYDPSYSGYGDTYKCPAGYYCPEGSSGYTVCPTGTYSTGGAAACSNCPSVTTYKRATVPSEYYVTSWSQSQPSWLGNGWSSITACESFNSYTSSRGLLYDYTFYNPSTGRYDTQSMTIWYQVNPGYYLKTPNSCGSYAYYAESAVCPEGYYCPGKTYVECNSSNASTVHTTNFGLNSCPSGYPNSDAGSDAASDCYTSCTKACTQQSCPSNATCTHGSSSTTGTQYYGGSCSAYASTCPITVTCNAGYYLSNGTCAKCESGYYCPGDNNRTACPSDYPNSSAGITSINSCYTNITRGCTQNDGLTPSGCAAVTAWNACSCAGGTYIKYYNGTTSGTTSNETCHKTPKTVTASANYYVSGAVCPACDSNYPYSDGGPIGSGACYTYITRGCTQNNGDIPSGCAAVTAWNACSCTGGTYIKYAGGITSGTTSNEECTKTPKTVTASANYYVSGTTCPACDSSYPYSDGGSIDSGSCYTNITRGCTQNNGDIPSGCASVTEWNACSCTGGTYVKYANGTTSGTTSNEECTKTPKTVTANANRYVSGTTCPACPTAYPSSDGGSIGDAYCYESKTNTGSQLSCSQPENSESYTCGTCNPGTCNWRDYKSATDTSCTPTDCNQPVNPGSVVCNTGYYTSGTTCPVCTNAPSNSSYTGTASSNTCPWECDDGYNLTSDNQCARYCMAGVTHIHLGTGLKIPLYSSKRTTPSINVRHNGTVCYADLIEGESTGLHVKYNGKTYHAAE